VTLRFSRYTCVTTTLHVNHAFVRKDNHLRCLLITLEQAVETSRRTFKAGVTRPIKFRRHQLEQLWRLLDENNQQICDAVYKDLHKHKNESNLGEIIPSKQEINDALDHLDEWAKDEHVKPALVNRFGVQCLKRKEPKGK
jgi:acyl-CoA reductase-like NAD-dependent aldehyde dehydrogenase